MIDFLRNFNWGTVPQWFQILAIVGVGVFITYRLGKKSIYEEKIKQIKENLKPFPKFGWYLRWMLERNKISDEDLDKYINLAEQAMIDSTPFDLEHSAGTIYYVHYMLETMKTIPDISNRVLLRNLIVDLLNEALGGS